MYKFILVPLHIEYLQTICFILVIAALVQFVEMFLKKAITKNTYTITISKNGVLVAVKTFVMAVIISETRE